MGQQGRQFRFGQSDRISLYAAGEHSLVHDSGHQTPGQAIVGEAGHGQLVTECPNPGDAVGGLGGGIAGEDGRNLSVSG